MIAQKQTNEPDHTTRTAFFIITVLLVGAAVMKEFPSLRRYLRFRRMP